MNTKQAKNQNKKTNTVKYLAIFIVVFGLIGLFLMLANSNIDVVDWVMKLHGG